MCSPADDFTVGEHAGSRVPNEARAVAARRDAWLFAGSRA